MFGVAVIYTIKDLDNGLEVKSSSGSTYSGKFDGKEYPTSGSNGPATVSLTRIDDHTIRLVQKTKSVTIRTSTLSVAGRTLTETVDIKGPGGAPLQSVMVFDRQQNQRVARHVLQ
jgi:hypothetical protein